MNTLSYGLLSFISLSPCTGYDLTRNIQYFWNAQHSQIYPLLAQLVEKGYVRYEVIAQSDKPDKKIYSITEDGLKEIREWIALPTDAPVVRDEFALKIINLSLVDRGTALQLLETREKQLEEKLKRLRKRIEDLSLYKNGSPAEWPSPLFGPGILVEKSIAVTRTELEWCKLVMQRLQDE